MKEETLIDLLHGLVDILHVHDVEVKNIINVETCKDFVMLTVDDKRIGDMQGAPVTVHHNRLITIQISEMP